MDDGMIRLTPAVELFFLNQQEQTMLFDTIDSEQATQSFSQAQRMNNIRDRAMEVVNNDLIYA